MLREDLKNSIHFFSNGGQCELELSLKTRFDFIREKAINVLPGGKSKLLLISTFRNKYIPNISAMFDTFTLYTYI